MDYELLTPRPGVGAAGGSRKWGFWSAGEPWGLLPDTGLWGPRPCLHGSHRRVSDDRHPGLGPRRGNGCGPVCLAVPWGLSVGSWPTTHAIPPRL